MRRDHIALMTNPALVAACTGLLILGTMLFLRKGFVPEFAPLAWLIPLAVYDLQKREVPHISFVAIPYGLAALAAMFRGDWTLGALALLLLALSERRHLPHPLNGLVLIPGLVGCASLLILTPFEQSPGAIALIGFWLAYELGWWAGADALAAMTLAVIWPDVRLLVSLAAAHLVLGIFIRRGPLLASFPKRLSPDELEQLGVAGLPTIALGAALFVIWQWWSV